MTDEQQETVLAYKSNGWAVVSKKAEVGIIIMGITDINPKTGKKTSLTAYIDANGSSQIV